MNYKTKTMDYEKLDKIFSKYEQIGNYVHRDRFDSLFEEIIELHEKSINKNSVIPDVSDYRLLEEWEMIQRLDEYTIDGVNWKPVEEWDIGQEYDKHNYHPLRRKK